MSFGNHAIAQGDVLEALRDLPDNSVDGCLSDFPYGLKFMAKKWDYDVPSVEVCREILRVLKPGAALLTFGGTRTFHRVVCNLEDAGFELRDCLMWLYAKGFPKSLNVGLAIDNAAGVERPITGTRVLTGNAAISTKEKGGTFGVQVGSIPAKEVNVTAPATELAEQWDGYGTALKPAWEPIILARKPLDGTVANNVAKWGVGALAIDACRIGTVGGTTKGPLTETETNAYGEGLSGNCDVVELEKGRWPANLALAHTEDCVATPNGEGCTSDCPIYMLNKQSGNRPSRPSVTRNGNGNQGGAVYTKRAGKEKKDGGYSDDGGAARFFFCAKVSTKEREFGCEGLPRKSAGDMTEREDGQKGLENPRAGAGRGGGAHNHHPTLKPLALVKWLASLIMPPLEANPTATLLVPYSGAGSEMIGALQAGWPCVFGIEAEPDYIAIANARIAAWGAE